MPTRIPIIFAHVVGWLLFISLLAGFLVAGPGSLSFSDIVFSGHLLFFCVVYVSIFYLNSNVLVPKLYFHRRYSLYFASFLALLILVAVLQPFDHLMAMNRPPEGFAMHEPGSDSHPRPLFRERHRPGHKLDIMSIILFIMLWTFGTVNKLMRKWQLSEQRILEVETEKVNAELSFLKAQINPHFLFNTLNNIYSLAVAKSDKTPSAIVKLSDILRYVTDDASQHLVSLQEEIDCITNYVELQRLRLTEKTQLVFTVEGDPNGKMIPPLILMTFIENVFKYGVSTSETAGIKVDIRMQGNTLEMNTSNQIFKTNVEAESTGIGMSNTRKRLAHLYPGRHQLAVGEANGVYTVKLTIDLL